MHAGTWGWNRRKKSKQSQKTSKPMHLWMQAPDRVSYAEGVAQHSPGSRQRTLGTETRGRLYPERVAQGQSHPLCNPFGVGRIGGSPSQGALARPWAVLCNAFGVERRALSAAHELVHDVHLQSLVIAFSTILFYLGLIDAARHIEQPQEHLPAVSEMLGLIDRP